MTRTKFRPFRRPRRLTTRERKLLRWALRRDPPAGPYGFLAQIENLRVVARDRRRRPGGVWTVFFDRPASEPIVGVTFAIGRTGSDPVSVALYAGSRTGRIASMDVTENRLGRPPVVFEVS